MQQPSPTPQRWQRPRGGWRSRNPERKDWRGSSQLGLGRKAHSRWSDSGTASRWLASVYWIRKVGSSCMPLTAQQAMRHTCCRGPAGQMVVKLMRYRSGAPVPIARASRTNGQWSVETSSGVRVAGGRLTLSPTGFIVARDNALFQYIAGDGLHSYGLPETHTLAAHQNGDISATAGCCLRSARKLRVETARVRGEAILATSWEQSEASEQPSA
jgi:hypothetical protein